MPAMADITLYTCHTRAATSAGLLTQQAHPRGVRSGFSLTHREGGMPQERCPVTGYLLTRPFEKQCPMPAVFVKDNSYLDGMLKPVLRPAGGDAGATAAAEQAAPAAAKQGKAAPVPVAAADGKSEGGKGKKKEKGPKAVAAAAGDADPKLEAFGKAQLQVGQVRMDATERR